MQSIWKRKWVIAALAMGIILAVGAVGAVAVAGPGDETVALAEQTTVTTAVQTPAGDPPGPALLGNCRDRIRGRVQDRIERIKERWTDTRENMSPEDQAAFDQLTQKAKDQRAQLEKDAQALRETLGQMRDLVQKYRPQATTTTTASPSAVQ
jgi:hypothetical protein